MVEVTNNAWIVAQDILKGLRKDVEIAKHWLVISGTNHALDSYKRAQDKLEGAKRIAMQIGLEVK